MTLYKYIDCTYRLGTPYRIITFVNIFFFFSRFIEYKIIIYYILCISIALPACTPDKTFSPARSCLSEY